MSLPDRRPAAILETERLRLAPLEEADAAEVFPLMADAEVMAFWDMPQVDDPDLVTKIVRSQVADAALGGSIIWSIRTLSDGDFVGTCDLSEIDRRHRRAEVGFMLGKGAWGQGYALEAMQAVVGYAAVSGLRRLVARIHLGNKRSENLLEKLGFKEEGLLRGHVLRDGERRDCLMFGLLL
jgi:ribosomal-protein-alanine N-acetyltransferase